jgi:hypothetical protein
VARVSYYGVASACQEENSTVRIEAPAPARLPAPEAAIFVKEVTHPFPEDLLGCRNVVGRFLTDYNKYVIDGGYETTRIAIRASFQRLDPNSGSRSLGNDAGVLKLSRTREEAVNA